MSTRGARVVEIGAPRDPGVDALAADLAAFRRTSDELASTVALVALRASALPATVGGRRPPRVVAIRRAVAVLQRATELARALLGDA